MSMCVSQHLYVFLVLLLWVFVSGLFVGWFVHPIHVCLFLLYLTHVFFDKPVCFVIQQEKMWIYAIQEVWESGRNQGRELQTKLLYEKIYFQLKNKKESPKAVKWPCPPRRLPIFKKAFQNFINIIKIYHFYLLFLKSISSIHPAWEKKESKKKNRLEIIFSSVNKRDYLTFTSSKNNKYFDQILILEVT